MPASGIARFSLGAAGILLLSAAWSLYSRPIDTAASANLFAVRKGNFELRVDSVGVLDAARADVFTSGMRGDRGKILQIADDGARVEKGDVLVRFDSTSLEAERMRLAGDLRSREAVVSFARQAVEVEKSQVEKSLLHAEMEARSAAQELGRHQAYIDDLEALGRRDVPVGSELAQARRKLQQSQNQYEKAQHDFERLKKEAVHRLAQSISELNKADSEAANTRAALELTASELEKTLLRASGPGFVVLHEITVNDQRRRLRVGDTVWQGQPVLYLPDLAAMTVRTRIREEDLHKVREGHEATVRIDAYPDAAFRGVVTGIGALALEGATATAGKFFQMNVAIQGRDDRLRPGMTARTSIVADRARDVLVIPIPAVFYSGEQAMCFVVDGVRVSTRIVHLGRRGDDVVEVVAGLAQGERVSLVKP